MTEEERPFGATKAALTQSTPTIQTALAKAILQESRVQPRSVAGDGGCQCLRR